MALTGHIKWSGSNTLCESAILKARVQISTWEAQISGTAESCVFNIDRILMNHLVHMMSVSCTHLLGKPLQ